jgi:hypothetical protein
MLNVISIIVAVVGAVVLAVVPIRFWLSDQVFPTWRRWLTAGIFLTVLGLVMQNYS